MAELPDLDFDFDDWNPDGLFDIPANGNGHDSSSGADDLPASGVVANYRGPSNDAKVEEEPEVLEAIKAVEEAEQREKAAQELYEQKVEETINLEKSLKEIEAQYLKMQQLVERARTDRFKASQDKNRAAREKAAASSLIETARQAVEVKREQSIRYESFVDIAKDKAWNVGVDGNTILPHQWIGAQMLATAGRAILGDDMGLGKTLTTIAALDLVKSRRTLVVTPAEVASNFAREITRWAPHRKVANIKGLSKMERNAVLDFAGSFEPIVIVVNYEAWRKDLNLIQRFIDFGFDTVILDESHTIKDVTTNAFKGCEEIINTVNVCPHCQIVLTREHKNERVCTRCRWAGQSFNIYDDEGNYLPRKEQDALIRSVKNFWAMTGTPILNNPADIFPPLHLIDKDVFYQRATFLRTYCEQNQYTGKWEFQPGGLRRLTTRLSGRYLARTLEDAGIELPPQTPIIHEVEMDKVVYPDQVRVVEQLAKHGQILLESGRAIKPLAFIALLTRQRQANVWPGGIQLKDEDGNVVFSVSEEIKQSAKIDRAVELIEEFTAKGERVVVFSQFTQALKETAARLDARGISNVQYHGETPDKVKDEIKANWDKSRGEEKKWDVVLAHYKSGGVGLNLTAARHTIILDQEWNPGKRNQAYKRTRRIGQDETTFVHVLNVSNTIDAWLQDLIDSKEEMIEGFNNESRDMQESYLKALQTGQMSG